AAPGALGDCDLAPGLQRGATAQQSWSHSSSPVRRAASPLRRRCRSKHERQRDPDQLVFQPGLPPTHWYVGRGQVMSIELQGLATARRVNAWRAVALWIKRHNAPPNNSRLRIRSVQSDKPTVLSGLALRMGCQETER